MEPQPLIDAERPPEHPFGRIHRITVPIEWAPTPSNPRRKARGFTTAMTETWSVAGTGFTSKVNTQVEPGSVLTFRIGPVTGQVAVRTTHPTEILHTSYYGVEFLTDELQAVASDLISIHLRHQPEEHRQVESPLEIAESHRENEPDWA